jgi:hypothetical protein
MKAFADAVYFIALLSTRDRWHARAIAINRQPPGLLVTTEWVLTEVGDAFSQPGAPQQFIRLLDLLRQQPDVDIIPSTSNLDRGAREITAKVVFRSFNIERSPSASM